jgi:hypothetical protein
MAEKFSETIGRFTAQTGGDGHRAETVLWKKKFDFGRGKRFLTVVSAKTIL